MFLLNVKASYDSAHFLRNYHGKCERLHGHRYVVQVALATPELNESGIAFDFVDIKARLRELADELDHNNLNELPPFIDVEPSAENQARYFFDEMKRRLDPAMGEAI